MEANFIGGHPMTGSENRHIKCHQYAFGKCILYYHPDRPDSKGRNFEFRDFVLSLGAIPLILDYKIHDYSTAAISHLPHMIAYSLVNLVPDR